MVFAVMGAYLTMAVPRLFSFPQLATWDVLLGIMLPYLLACIFFGMTVSCLVRYRENVMLLVVFLSVPLLFLSGVSWPQSAIPGAWQGVSWLFPSTFGIRAYVRANSMGATLSDIMLEYRCLWIQAGFYFCLCCLVYRHQILQARHHARERAAQMERKHEVRRKLAARKA
jgi:ABC-2 type transport system permease protein